MHTPFHSQVFYLESFCQICPLKPPCCFLVTHGSHGQFLGAVALVQSAPWLVLNSLDKITRQGKQIPWIIPLSGKLLVKQAWEVVDVQIQKRASPDYRSAIRFLALGLGILRTLIQNDDTGAYK